MAKVQKNLQLPQEAADWFNKMEQTTGVSHSRLALASILSYLFQGQAGRQGFMELSMMVESGEIRFNDLYGALILSTPKGFDENLAPDVLDRLSRICQRIQDEMRGNPKP